MVEILSEGLYGKVKFKCKNCKCEFIVDEKECEEDWSIYNIPWVHECPLCKSRCTSCDGCRKE